MPILMSKEEYNRIKKWTQPDKEDPDTARRREYVKYLDETSKQMCKDWPNSLENVNKRNEELRRARIEAAEATNTNFYKKYVKRQQDEQKKLMYSARQIIFKNKDAPKLLLSAVIETAVQKEREVQVAFQNERRREAEEQKRREDDDIIARAKAWNELMATKKRRRFDTNKQHQKEILDQAHEIVERNRKEYEDELQLQILDNVKAQQQMDAIHEFEKNFKAAEKDRIWSDMQRSKEESDKRKSEQNALDQMDDQLIEVLIKSRNRIVKKRKETEKQIQDERLRVLENISKKLESGDAAREAKDQAILNNAIKKKEAIDDARREAQRRKEEKFREARVEARRKFLRDEEIRKHKEQTMKSWSIMNRFKNQEIYDDFQEQLRVNRARKTKEYREELLRLWKERRDREAQEDADRRYFYGERAERELRAADNKLLTHGNALLQEASALGRPLYPIHRALDQYCKIYRLYPMPDLPRSMKEHFQKYAPTDGSNPDPNYKEPPPPVPDEPPSPRESLDQPHQKANGLQDVEKDKKSKSEKIESTNNKRNGLQNAKALEQDMKLPPIPKQCGCDCTTKDQK